MSIWNCIRACAVLRAGWALAAFCLLAGVSGPGAAEPSPPASVSNPVLAVAPSHRVRALYIIPSNRTAQPDAIKKFQWALLYAHDYYEEQMERYGFGRKGFTYETEADGVTPTINIFNAPRDDTYYRTSTWTRLSQDAISAGWTVKQAGEVWVLVYEGHGMDPDGTVTYTHGIGGGGLFGSGWGGCALSADVLALMTRSDLRDTRSWDGMVIPGFGPYPLVRGKSFPWYSGETLSATSSAMLGRFIHELSHGFGLAHNFRNDELTNGHIMGNGLRGVRGATEWDLFPKEYALLGYGEALALNNNRYFNPTKVYTEDIPPAVSVETAGDVALVDGKVRIQFSASDASGLTAAWLQTAELIAEMPLTGTSARASFETPICTLGAINNYQIVVFDTQGNAQIAACPVKPVGSNQAPRPFITATAVTAPVGTQILFDAAKTTDPDHPLSQLQVEWDLDGDGIFESAPMPYMGLMLAFTEPGIRMVRARLSDPMGGTAVSAPLPVRIIEPHRNAAEAWALYR